MSNNIQHEAVHLPAVYNLRGMAHPIPTRNGAKGSYELYETQQKIQETPELKKLNTTVETAPGSPGSFQDYNKVVEKLQKELEDSKRKESVLQQLLADLKNPLTNSGSNFLENTYFDEPLSTEAVGESVKDAHIRHLQRQVTVLQANLYKSEGWANRVATAVKERDKALDDVARLTVEIRDIKETNCQLLRKIDSLTTALQEAHKNLQLSSEQLQTQQYSAQLVAQLKEEIVRQKTEIKTLKESVDRLDLDNKSIKDVTLESGSHSLNNIACSQELEHLHKVVDKLKNTVLQQRTYLLQLKKPTNMKSLSLSSPVVNTDGGLDHDSLTGSKSSSPKFRGSGLLLSTETFGNLPQSSVLGHSNQALGLKSGSPREAIFEMRHHGGSECLQERAARKQPNSREILDETLNVDVLNIPSTPATQAGGVVESSRHTSNMASRHGNLNAHKRYSPPGYLTEQEYADGAEQNLGQNGLTVSDKFEPVRFAQYKQKPSQLDVLGQRSVQESLSQEKANVRCENLPWQARPWNLSSANNSATVDAASASDYMATYSQTEPGPMLNLGHSYLPLRSASQVQQEIQGKMNESTILPAENQGQYVLNGSTAQMLHDSSGAGGSGNTNVNSAKTFLQQIYQSPLVYQGQLVQEPIQEKLLAGEKKAIVAPPSHCQASQAAGGRQEVVYVNASGSQGMYNLSSSSVDPGPSEARLNSGKLCPVCNNDYSHVSIEEFQTHVFECFDDENPPETMKAATALPVRICPMCSASFSHAVLQAEYEKHVHGHFIEDNAEGFEILHN